MKFRVIITQDENGFYVAEVPSLPGCISQGKTREEALENIKDAHSWLFIQLKKTQRTNTSFYRRRSGRSLCLNCQ
jgi:antitoxin HicB